VPERYARNNGVSRAASSQRVRLGRERAEVVVNQAIDTLPGDLRAYFENNRSFFVQHVTDPLDTEAKTPAERHNHFIRLDKYGRFPFMLCPRLQSRRKQIWKI